MLSIRLYSWKLLSRLGVCIHHMLDASNIDRQIVTAIYERKPCFLASPEWRDVAFDKNGLAFDDSLHADLIQYMADLPGILKDLKELNHQPIYQTPHDNFSFDAVDPNLDVKSNFDETPPESCPSLDYSPDSLDSLDFLNDVQPVDIPYPVSATAHAQLPARAALLQRAQNLKDALYELGKPLNAKLVSGSAAVELPSIQENSPIPTTYHFTSWRDMTGYSCFWSLLILANKVSRPTSSE